jgi:hypothetical protein
MNATIQSLIEKLTGQKVPLEENISILSSLQPDALELGYSQFNELLLFLGYDRISRSFFQFLVDGTLDYKHGAVINSLSELEKRVNKAIEYFLRLFGNIKFGYKQLSTESNEEEFEQWHEALQPLTESHYSERHSPLFQLRKIPNDDTYFLGYIIQREIDARLSVNPQDSEALQMQEKKNKIVMDGIENHKAYLASDHMDVYVATSMRQKHEYLFIGRITEQIFSHPSLTTLNVRYFDPTQAYCSNRIDKGIAEALMLKRAKCTIYLAQESDTLGKDSELASTLAQGKTVIAYIPRGDKQYVDKLLEDLIAINPSKSRKQIILEQLRTFNPDLCWIDPKLRDWIDSGTEDIDYGAETLRDTHPLGIQVNLETGVANGVIVTREVGECAVLVREVLLRQLMFDVVEELKHGIPYILLKESRTQSIYRVSTGERLLTNTFWNYYLPK